jgi:hypothetical protein
LGGGLIGSPPLFSSFCESRSTRGLRPTQQFFIHQTLTFLQFTALGSWLSNQRSVFAQPEGRSADRRPPPSSLLNIFSIERVSLGEIFVRRTSLPDKKNRRPSLEWTIKPVCSFLEIIFRIFSGLRVLFVERLPQCSPVPLLIELCRTKGGMERH